MLLEIAKKYENNYFAMIKGKYYLYCDVASEYERIKEIVEKKKWKEKSAILVLDGSFVSIITFLVLLDSGFVVALVKAEDPFCEKKEVISSCMYKISFVGDSVLISSLDRRNMSELMFNYIKKEQAGIIIFSSGTSGEPKGALHNARKFLDPHEGSREKKRKLVLFLELDHIGGLNTFFGSYYGGSTLLVPEDKTVIKVCKIIENERADILPTTPSFLNMMYLCKAFDNHDLSSLKIISYGTEKMRQELLEKISKKIPKVKLVQTYGLSELGIMKTVSKNNSSLQMKIGGTGFEYKLVDGELYIKSDYAMEGYLNAATPFDNEGWYNTHDVVDVRENGFLEIVGRNTDIVNINGLKCNLLEIEETILSNFEEVEDCLVFLKPHSILGSVLGVKIKFCKDVNKQDFKRKFYVKCDSVLPKYMVPTQMVFTDEPLNSYRWKKERSKYT